ncbi:serine-rich adhesin for platelets-like isoform X3 [Biomphalaria glabrata]|uniref:Serine-rich adhesin for platelets-like isoform X3 n=1 Tax=Biomphalaria glabrata TaxID=6526 RepID=A0A9W3B1F9_BIOGL|nr:serine-rich adhesin for platelets-like isoform X3 [Biomphalaria glabrata]
MPEKASQGEGKKRRSFLPSFRKVPTASVQQSPQIEAPLQPPFGGYSSHVYSSPSSHAPAVSLLTSSPVIQLPPQAPPSSVSTSAYSSSVKENTVSRKEKEVESPAFGVGLRVGARIKIGGVKPGILRYLGTTHLAPGIFCGIELFDPDGNHDGEVNGHRYFNCRPNHGIFAPKEKVCLDTSSSLSRLASSSEGSYSSTESLNERTNKAFKCFEEGELEAIDCTKPSPTTSPQDSDITFHSDQSKYFRSSHFSTKNKALYGLADQNILSDVLDYTEIPQKKSKSSLPVAKSGIPSVFSSHSKLPTFARTSYNKYEEPASVFKRTSGVPGQHQNALTTSANYQASVYSDQENERCKTASARSSEDSEDDGLQRETLSRGIKKQLRADSRQYLNFTFDPEEEMSQIVQPEDSEEGENVPSDSWYREHRESFDKYENSAPEVTSQEYSAPNSQTDPGSAHFHYQDAMMLDQKTSITYEATQSNGFTQGISESNSSQGSSVPDSDIVAVDMLTEANDSRGYQHYDEDGVSTGGYASTLSGGGCSDDLSRPLDSLTSQSGRMTQARGTLLESQVQAQEADNKRGYSKVEKSHVHSFQSQSDSATSSPSKKYRKISTDSFNYEGGDSSSSGTEPKTDSSGEARGENLEDSSTGASPEVSQALEWDYGQEFEGKIPIGQQDSTMTTSASTGTSESLSDASRDVSEHSDGAIEPEMPSSVIDDSELFETPDNDFENIDSLDDFPIFGKDSKSMLTDSGISDKSFDMCASKSSTVCGSSSDDCSREDDTSSHTTTRAVSSDSSQETLAAEYAADTPVSVEDKDFLADEVCPTSQTADCFGDMHREGDNSFGDGNSNSPASVMSLEDVTILQDSTVLEEDETKPRDSEACPPGECVRDHRSKRDRPISLISTTSADTGYVPDTDSELGTLTTNSPNVDWLDKRCAAHSTSSAPADDIFDEGLNSMDFSLDEDLTTVCEPKAMSTDHLKSTDDEDYNSDLTTNTEDDRTEADQVYGLSRDNSICQEDSSARLVPPGETGDQSHSVHDSNEMNDTDDNRMNVDSADNKEVDDKKDDQQPKVKHKKITITKKRSENVDHKLPNINVTSKLADYIKAPLPAKPKEEKEAKKARNKAVNKKSNAQEGEHKAAKEDISTSRHSSPEREPVIIAKPKPIIKRAPPKSKWGNIMSQIEASKDTVKPKPKSEIKSSLAAYLSAPVPQLPADQTSGTKTEQPQNTNVKKKEFVKRIKDLPPPPPKLDLSKVKSKLNVPTAASAVKAMPKRDRSPGVKVRNTSPGGHVSRKDQLNKRLSEAYIVLERQGMSTNASSVRSSHTDISTNMEVDISAEGEVSKACSNTSADVTRNEHRQSVSSVKSVMSEALHNKMNEMKTLQDGGPRPSVRKNNQSKKPRVIGPAKSSTISSATSNNANKSQKEIIRLESLCESRTKELIQTKILLKDAATGFDAMTILVNYCCNELNAFECPFLAQRLEKIKGKLAEYLNQINELNNEKERLNQCLATALQEKEESSRQVQETLTLANQEREDHMRITHEMDDTHNASLTAQRDELTKKHEEALQKYIQYYDKQLDLMKHAHERQVSEMKNENKLEINGLKIAHLEEIQGLRNKHDSQMEDLHQQHRNKLEDITLRFESIKLTLSDKVESLRGECEELRHRARNSEEALQRDADVKVQMALAPYMSLPKEIESLKTVVEMRNEEIQKLRNKNTDQEKILEELPIAKEKIISLQQKVENLEAIINIKSDHEKQLHEHCQILMRKYDRASRANKRLSMDYEQVMWRMSQSSEFGSCESLTHRQLSKSPPPRSDHGSPEGRHRNISPNIAGDVVMRKKRNSHSVGDGDRKLRSRSATFVVEKDDNSDIHSPSSSPQPKLKRWRKKIVGDDKLLSVEGRAERMCRSAGSEIFSDFSQKQNKPESDDSNILADGTDNMMSSVEMADSYSRSISGVSDSGVYDSMSRSDMLNSSVISTDSEWVVSANSSLILDNSAEDDNALQSGDYSSLNEMYLAQTPGARSFIKASNTVVFCPASKEATGEDCLESGPLDNVFDDILSMDSSICSLDNLDINGSDKPTS